MFLLNINLVKEYHEHGLKSKIVEKNLNSNMQHVQCISPPDNFPTS